MELVRAAVIRDTGPIRNTPLTRKTPLRQRKPISRTRTSDGRYEVVRFDRVPDRPAPRDSWIAVVEQEFESEPVARPKPKRKRVRNDIPPSSRRAVKLRSHGLCEAMLEGCTVVARQIHHRKLRRSGDHTPINLLDVCLHCHHAVIHRHVAWSYEHGFLVRFRDDPAVIPVQRGAQLRNPH